MERNTQCVFRRYNQTPDGPEVCEFLDFKRDDEYQELIDPERNRKIKVFFEEELGEYSPDMTYTRKTLQDLTDEEACMVYAKTAPWDADLVGEDHHRLERRVEHLKDLEYELKEGLGNTKVMFVHIYRDESFVSEWTVLGLEEKPMSRTCVSGFLSMEVVSKRIKDTSLELIEEVYNSSAFFSFPQEVQIMVMYQLNKQYVEYDKE